MATIRGTALTAAREAKGISARSLGRRVAERLGSPERGKSLRVILSRYERREESEVDRELLEALAAELGLGEADLGEEPVWTWVAAEPHLSFIALGLRQILYTSPEAAYDSRDTLALELREGNPLRGATLLHPVFRGAVTETLEANFGELTDLEERALMVLDPTPGQLRELVLAQGAASGTDPEQRRFAVRALFAAAGGGILETLLQPDQLYALSARRLAHAVDAPAALREKWQTETSNLLDADVEWQKERRKQLAERHGTLNESDPAGTGPGTHEIADRGGEHGEE